MHAAETIDPFLVAEAPFCYKSVLRIDINTSPLLSFENMVWTKLFIFPSDVVSLMAFTISEIWKTPNAACFENQKFVVNYVIARAYTIWSECTTKGGK